MSIKYQNKNIKSVLDFGAIPNSDATTSIQAALNASSGYTLSLGGGSYNVGNLVVNVPCKLVDGTLTSNVASGVILTISSNNVVLDSLELNGGSQSQGVFISDGYDNITIKNCYIHDIYSDASTSNAILFSDSNSIKILDNHIYNVKSSTQAVPVRAIRGDGTISPHSIVIKGNTIDYVDHISVSGSNDADGIVIQNYGMSDIIIAENTFRRCGKRAIKIQSAGCLVSDNSITMSSGSIDPYAAISLYASNCVATSNRIYGPCTFAGIGIGGGSEGQVVTGNQIDFGSHSNVSLDGINTDVGASNYSVVSGNSIKGTHRSGVRLSHACTGVSISSNISKGASASAYIMTASGTACSFVGNVGISHAHYLLHDNNIGTTSKCVAVGNSNDGGGFGPISATFLADAQVHAHGNGTTSILTGAGSPESSVTAGVGCIYLRTGGGTSTTFYVKETGTGNTGWVAK